MLVEGACGRGARAKRRGPWRSVPELPMSFFVCQGHFSPSATPGKRGERSGMPIIFPDLRATRCVNFASCGWIETKESAILRLLKRQPKPWMIARYRSPNGGVYVRAGFGGEDGTH